MDKILAPIKNRIIKYLKIKEIKQDLFYKETGISASNFKGDGKRSELGGEKLAKILTLYPDLSAEWLLTGEGEMLKTKSTDSGSISNAPINVPPNAPFQKVHKNGTNNLEIISPSTIAMVSKLDPEGVVSMADMTIIPIVDISAAAGGGGAYNSDHLTLQDSIVLPPNMVRKGLHHCIQIKGDSMAPTLQDGGYIIIRQLDRSEWAEVRNEYIYVVTDREGRTFIKRLRNRFHEHGFIVCTSDNPDKNAYRNFNLYEEDIHNIWFVEWYLSAKMPNIHAAYYDQLQDMRNEVDDIKYFLEKQFKKPITRN